LISDREDSVRISPCSSRVLERPVQIGFRDGDGARAGAEDPAVGGFHREEERFYRRTERSRREILDRVGPEIAHIDQKRDPELSCEPHDHEGLLRSRHRGHDDVWSLPPARHFEESPGEADHEEDPSEADIVAVAAGMDELDLVPFSGYQYRVGEGAKRPSV